MTRDEYQDGDHLRIEEDCILVMHRDGGSLIEYCDDAEAMRHFKKWLRWRRSENVREEAERKAAEQREKLRRAMTVVHGDGERTPARACLRRVA